MKKIIAYILIGILCIAAAAGVIYGVNYKKANTKPSEIVEEQEDLSSEDALKKAEKYLKTIYKDVAKETPRDYERIGVVPIGEFKFPVTWSVDVSEEYVKVVVNENGIVTIDVNEECSEDVPYVLTATIKDEKGNIRKLTWEHVIPKKITGTYQEIVDMAYALKPGESLPNEATLQGTVTTINTPWDSGYQNITVTITVAGREDKPIQCYRMKSGAADASKVEKGDLITVTGILKNYNGTIEFDAGCVLDANEKGKGTILKVTGTMQEIVDKAYALKDGETLKGEATLTGTVTAINTAWNDQYKNISVTIAVEGREDKPIQCYRLKSGAADASKIAKGDLITVTGVLKNFKGTIEFDAGCVLDANEKGKGTILKVTGTMQEIVDKAYALKDGEVLKGEATLTGTVTAINTAWSADFKNISVTIVVEGREDKPIQCYRMKSGAADASQVKKGDLITVTGLLKNFKGTIEFDAGCTLEANKKGAGTIETVTGSMQEIVDKAYALKEGEVLKGEATLQGTVTAIGSEWSDQYKNITVTIAVEGREDKPIECYRLKSGAADASKIEKGDLITVTGMIKNYNGKIEFDAGCTLDANKKGAGTINTVTGTMQEIVDKAYALEEGTALEGEATLTGSVTKVNTPYSDQYKNVTVTIVVDGREDKPIECYRLKGTNADKVAVGDKITVVGILKNFYGKVEFDAGCQLTDWVQGGGTYVPEEPDVPDVPVVPDQPDVPVVPTTAYKMSMYQGKVDKTVYFTGAMDGFYLATSENVEDAVEIYKEEVEGGEYLYFMVGDTANYLYIFKSGTYTNAGFTEDVSLASVFVLNEEYNTYVTTVEGKEFFLGTRNDKTYTTIGACGVDYIGTNFKAVLEAVEVPEETPTAYKMSMYQGKVDKTVYFTGAMDGFYLATSENVADAVDIYKEEVEGGEHLYFMVGDTVNYLYIFKSGTYTNAGFTEDVSLASVFVLNEEYNTYVTTVEGKEFFLGTRNDKTYTTIGACGVDYIGTNFKAVLEEVEDNESDTAATLADAIAGLQAEYTAEMNVTGEYVLSPSIAIDGTEFTITWSIQTANEAVAKIVDGKLVIAAGTEDVEYTLTATVKDATGATDTWTKTATVAKVEGEQPSEEQPFVDGDQVVIYAPAYNKALSVTKAGNYNAGVDVTVTDGTVAGYADTEVWTVTVNADGTYSFTNGENKLSMNDQYSSLQYNASHDTWSIADLGNGLYTVKNATRTSNYGDCFLQWSSYGNWSTYGSSDTAAAGSDRTQLAFYVIPSEAEEPQERFVKVTEAPADWSGTYLIVYEDAQKVFDGSLTTLDAVSDYKTFDIADGQIEATDETKAVQFTITKSGDSYTIKSASGYFIGQTSNKNGLASSQSEGYTNTISMNADGSVNIISSGGAYLRFNAGPASGKNDRFRYYKSSTYTNQKAITLYKLVEE